MELKTISEIGVKNISIHSRNRKTLKNYVNLPEYKITVINGQREWKPQPSIDEDKKCVVAYCKNCLGVVFIIKAKTKYISYVHLHKAYYGFNTFLITEREAIKLIKDGKVCEAELNEDDISKINNMEVVRQLNEKK